MKIEVGIIILNWNGKEISINCINSLKKYTNFKNYKIIFVDNGSTDGSVNAIRKKFPKIDIIINKKNIGFPKGMNIGIKYAKRKYNPKYFLLLNNDLIFFQKNWLKELLSVFKNKKIGIASPIMVFPNKKLQRAGSKIKNDINLIITSVTSTPERITKKELKRNKLREINVFLGSCFLIKKEIIEKVGLLDERYSPYLVEDLEYSFRVQKAGYKIVTATNSEVIHLLHKTFKDKIIKEEEKDIKRGYIVIRNAFLFSLEYLGILKSILITLLLLFITAIIEKKDKDKGQIITNFRLRKNLFLRFINFFKSIRDAIKLHKKSI